MYKIIFSLVLSFTFAFSNAAKDKISKTNPIDENRYYFQSSILVPKNKKVKLTYENPKVQRDLCKTS